MHSHKYPHEETASYLIYRIGRLLRRQAVLFFTSRGLTISPEQWSVLLKVNAAGPTPLGALADAKLHDHPNVTRIVDGLEKMGFVERIKNPDDRRSQLVTSTPKGALFVEQTLPELIEEKARFYDGLDELDIKQLLKTLKTIENNIEE